MSAPRKPAPRPRRSAASARVAPTRGALRVVAGTHGGRLFDSVPGEATRPTAARVREAAFNALVSLDAVDGARVLDAFAGSGALGIEALSRGAAHVTFAERDGAARSVVEANLAALGLAAAATVVGGDGARTVVSGAPWDLVLLDPPYRYEGWGALLHDVSVVLSPHGVVVVESDHEVELPDGLVGLRLKQYGSTVVQFASPAGAPS